MKTIYVRAFIWYTIGISVVLTKPFYEEKAYNDENKLHCMDSNDGISFDKANPNLLADDTQYDGPNKLSKFDNSQKRFVASDESDEASEEILQKRQVGVVYQNEKPIGILQPYQRSYRFIPVKEENSRSIQEDDILNDAENLADLDKRETEVEESYPLILTKFKIGTKLDQKRNFDTMNEDNVRNLKATIRRLRSSNSNDNKKIEEELKNILDDMGLIDDEEIHPEKREISENKLEETKSESDRMKRDDNCVHNENSDANIRKISEQTLDSEDKSNKKSDGNNEILRKKRQKQDVLEKENSDLVENLKDSGDLMLSGNKSPLASAEITAREADYKDDEKNIFEEENKDSRIERQIQDRINSLKEEVKREIAALKEKETDDDEEDDVQRKKRQIFETLADEETDDLNPALNVGTDLKPLIRKRRETTNHTGIGRKKRDTNLGVLEKRSDLNKDEKDDSINLLGGDDLEDGVLVKRQTFNNDYDNDFLSEKKSSSLSLGNENGYDKKVYDDDQMIQKDDNLFDDKIADDRLRPARYWKSRFRRRINYEDSIGERPQQLSDMSDFDLFGALPQSYDGELSRYKRVK